MSERSELQKLLTVKRRVEEILREAKEGGILSDFSDLQIDLEALSVRGLAYYYEEDPKRIRRPPGVQRLKEAFQQIEHETDTVILIPFLPEFKTP